MTSHPLSWPEGWRRTKDGARLRARFKKYTTVYYAPALDQTRRESYTKRGEVTIAEGVRRCLVSLTRFGVRDSDIIISTNLLLRNDGLPRSGQSEPKDPGVALYWKLKGQQQVMAIDLYDRVADNLAAVAATLEAMRAIERHGGAQILERTFRGFLSLPPPKDWRAVLHLGPTATLAEATSHYRKQALQAHPDQGGSHEAMAQLNAAFAVAQRELT